jgi:two-component system response regulator AtoC
MVSILYIDDDPKAQRMLNMVLGEKYRIVSAYTGESGLSKLREEEPDLVLLDIDLPDSHGLDVLERIMERRNPPPVIMLTILTDTRLIVSAVRTGAYDYIVKPFDMKELEGSIWRAVQQSALRCSRAESHPALDAIMGESREILNVKDIIPRWAKSDVPVLVLGESGTGKELVARAIHELSPRAAGPFITVNCSAIPQSIVESEMFGSEKGAYTDAVSRPGFFERGDAGSVFLDEIGEMPLQVQAKFLRVIENKEAQRVGGNSPIKINTRIIAATNRNLKDCVGEGTFRDDLYFRLAVLPIFLPPLRERIADIPLLASHLLAEASGGRKRISAEALAKLCEHGWPGNVRELRNTLERACLLADEETILGRHVVFG